MMRSRGRFLFGAAAAAASVAWGEGAGAASFVTASAPRTGDRLTLAEMLAAYPAPASGDVVQYELGFGAQYDKQIGFGVEHDGPDRRAYVETQVGNGDHACNPNTLKKVYVKGHAFADAFTPYPALAYVTRSSNMMTRWGDGVGPAAADLLLLDTKTLYDPRRATVARVSRERVKAAGRTFETTRLSARYADAGAARLRTVDLWLSPEVPLALVRMRATAPELDPFELSLYSFTRTFKTSLALSLSEVRAMTGTSGDVPVLQN